MEVLRAQCKFLFFLTIFLSIIILFIRIVLFQPYTKTREREISIYH